MKRDRANQPLRVDQLARGIRDRVALIFSEFDGADEAMQICRDLHEIFDSGDYELRFRGTDGKHDTTRHDLADDARGPARLRGRRMHARYQSLCATCGGLIKTGDPIVYNADQRQAAHDSCGEAG